MMTQRSKPVSENAPPVGLWGTHPFSDRDPCPPDNSQDLWRLPRRVVRGMLLLALVTVGPAHSSLQVCSLNKTRLLHFESACDRGTHQCNLSHPKGRSRIQSIILAPPLHEENSVEGERVCLSIYIMVTGRCPAHHSLHMHLRFTSGGKCVFFFSFIRGNRQIEFT